MSSFRCSSIYFRVETSIVYSLLKSENLRISESEKFFLNILNFSDFQIFRFLQRCFVFLLPAREPDDGCYRSDATDYVGYRLVHSESFWRDADICSDDAGHEQGWNQSHEIVFLLKDEINRYRPEREDRQGLVAP